MIRTGPASTEARRNPLPGCMVGTLLALPFLTVLAVLPAQGQRPVAARDTTPALGLDQGVMSFRTPHFRLDLVRSSQTAAALRPLGTDDFDFTPSDWLGRRAASGYFHLGDLPLRLREGTDGDWRA